MRRSVLAAVVCCVGALSAAGDARAANAIWIPANNIPRCGLKDLLISFVAGDGIDREFTAYGVVYGPVGREREGISPKAYNLAAGDLCFDFPFKEYPEPLVEYLPFLPRLPFPIVILWLTFGPHGGLHETGEYKVVIALFDPNKPITKIEDAFQVYTERFSACD